MKARRLDAELATLNRYAVLRFLITGGNMKLWKRILIILLCVVAMNLCERHRNGGFTKWIKIRNSHQMDLAFQEL